MLKLKGQFLDGAKSMFTIIFFKVLVFLVNIEIKETKIFFIQVGILQPTTLQNELPQVRFSGCFPNNYFGKPLNGCISMKLLL